MVFPSHLRHLQSQYYALYSHIFPVIMRLAIDVDQVTRQLFAPLAFQTIHWFTNNVSPEAPETVLLLMTCLDGVVDPANSPLRDFSSECVAEFLKWSIKQSKHKSTDALSANSILKRLYALLSHPNAYKRLGAALTFNKLYRIVREEETLVDTFILEITVNGLLSLKLAALDDPELGLSPVLHLESDPSVSDPKFILSFLRYHPAVKEASGTYEKNHCEEGQAAPQGVQRSQDRDNKVL